MINLAVPIVDFHLENRRTLELITEIDQKIERNKITLDLFKSQFLQQIQTNPGNHSKLIKLRMGIDKLIKKLMVLTDTKIELINKIDISATYLIDSIDDFLSKHEGKEQEKPQDKEGPICFCKKRTLGRVIRCANANCEIGSYHLKCLNYSKIPDNPWCCSSECRQQVYFSPFN